MNPSLLALAALVLSACGPTAPTSLVGRTATTVETTATGAMQPVGTSRLVFTTSTSGTIDGAAATYTYSAAGAVGTLDATVAPLTAHYLLTFETDVSGSYLGTVTAGGTGDAKGTFTVTK